RPGDDGTKYEDRSGESQIAEHDGNDHHDANDVEDVHPNSPPKWTHGCPQGRCFVFNKELRGAKGSASRSIGGPEADPPPDLAQPSGAYGRHSSRSAPL